MLTPTEFNFIKKIVFDALKFNYSGKIELVQKEGAYVKYEKGIAYVGCENKILLARGLMLLAKYISEKKENFEVHQIPHFDMCGGMLDMSRNAVMRVETVKEYLNVMACMGINVLMLYTEDTYEVDGYPFFGYMRGRYTVKELNEIDDYAYRLGIEVIPCIQTLGHLEQYLRWQEANELKDTPSVLLCGEEKVKTFVDALINTARKSFRSKRIHIGMDEAHDVGLGNYLRKNGYRNRFDILNGHLSVVVNICKKYDFKPMMWSDMYFRLGSKTGSYYDIDCSIPSDKIELIPNVDLVYWDYYHIEDSFYDKMIKTHQTLNKNIIFAGGIRTWSGFLPNLKHTLDTMMPALKTCCLNGIKEVFATMWGDDGAETNLFFSLPGLSVFSEFCYIGANCTKDDITAMSEFVTKAKANEFEALSDFHYSPNGFENMGKRLVYTDILYNLTGNTYDSLNNFKCIYEKSYNLIKHSGNEAWRSYYEYALKLFEIIIIKCDVMFNLRKAYKAGDFECMNVIAKKKIPGLLNKYKELLTLHKVQWTKTYKIFGWEVINARYGAVIARLEYAEQILNNYIDKKIDRIEEFEFEYLIETNVRTGTFKEMISTSVYLVN